jgi:hypothetical protein
MGWRWGVRQETMREAASAILSLFDAPGGVTFSYLVIIKSMTHTNLLYYSQPSLHRKEIFG